MHLFLRVGLTVTPLLLFGACGQVSDESSDKGTGGDGGTNGQVLGCSALAETECLMANRDTPDDLDDCKWVKPVRIGHVDEGGLCSERDEGTCTDIDGPNCGDQDAPKRWLDDTGTVWQTSNSCGLPEFEHYPEGWTASAEPFPCDGVGGEGGQGGRH